MISKMNLLEMYNEEVVFRGFSRNNEIINDQLDYNRATDWNGMHFVMPYVNKRCMVIEQNQDGSIQCEFEHCDMNGNITGNGLISGLSFEFAEYSDGIIDYDPVFERIDEQPNILINHDIQMNNDIPLNNNIIDNIIDNIINNNIIDNIMNNNIIN